MTEKQDEFDRQFDIYMAATQPNAGSPEGYIKHLRRSGFVLVKANSPQPFAQGEKQ